MQYISPEQPEISTEPFMFLSLVQCLVVIWTIRKTKQLMGLWMELHVGPRFIQSELR